MKSPAEVCGEVGPSDVANLPCVSCFEKGMWAPSACSALESTDYTSPPNRQPQLPRAGSQGQKLGPPYRGKPFPAAHCPLTPDLSFDDLLLQNWESHSTEGLPRRRWVIGRGEAHIARACTVDWGWVLWWGLGKWLFSDDGSWAHGEGLPG